MSGSDNHGGTDFGGGGGVTFNCTAVSIQTNIISPDPTVLSGLSVGNVLEIQLRTVTGPLIAVTAAGDILGTVFTTDPSSLINCINTGYTYEAIIRTISGGNVQILIRNA